MKYACPSGAASVVLGNFFFTPHHGDLGTRKTQGLSLPFPRVRGMRVNTTARGYLKRTFGRRDRAA